MNSAQPWTKPGAGAGKGNDFSPHWATGDTEVSRDQLTWLKHENSFGTEAGENPRASPLSPLCRLMSGGELSSFPVDELQ